MTALGRNRIYSLAKKAVFVPIAAFTSSFLLDFHLQQYHQVRCFTIAANVSDLISNRNTQHSIKFNSYTVDHSGHTLPNKKNKQPTKLYSTTSDKEEEGMMIDSEYPGTAVSRLKAVHERVAQLTESDLNGPWEEVRRKILWAGGLRGNFDPLFFSIIIIPLSFIIYNMENPHNSIFALQYFPTRRPS